MLVTHLEIDVCRTDAGLESESAPAPLKKESPPVSPPRLACVDILRGYAVILMTLDHTRDFFTSVPFAPEDLAHTSGPIFFTRWITHFCAPIFFLLAGTGAYLSFSQGRSRAEVARFLWTRGLFLVFLDLTVINFAWTAEFPLFSGVLWTLGWSMVALSFVIRLRLPWIAALGAVIVGGHNLLDHLNPAALGIFGPLWLILHGYGAFWILPGKVPFSVVWPLLPWMGVMLCGYALGAILCREDWRKIVLGLGAILTVAFIASRFFHLYGNSDPSLFGVAAGPWSHQPTATLTLASFLNTLKFPPSLQFLLMTLGPTLMALAWLGTVNPRGWLAKRIGVFGRVPLFFYAIHLFVIRTAAVYTGLIFKQKAAWLLYGGVLMNARPSGYGHGLPFVYTMTFAITLFLYPFCKGFMQIKQGHPEWKWLRYL